MKSFTLGLAAFIFLAFTPASFAATDDVIGTVLEVEGSATIATAGNLPVGIAVNTPVHATDVITTGPASRVYIQLIDNTEFTIGENGQMTVDDYAFDNQNKDANHAAYSVIKGAFLYVSGLVAKKENPDVKVNVPVGSIGIRGTKFWGGNVSTGYDVIVGEGEVELATPGGKVRIKKGQGTSVKAKGAAPEAPKIWPKTKIDKAVATIALKEPAVVGERMKANAANNEQLRVLHREKVIQREIFEREQKRLQNETKTEDTLTKDNGDAAAARRKRLQEERERRFNSSITPDTTTKTVRSVTDEPVKSTVETVRNIDTTTTGTVSETTTTTVETVGDTVNTTVEKTTESIEKPAEATTNAVRDTVETTTSTVNRTLEGSTGAVKNTSKALTKRHKD